ncbi:hypothetical protein D3C83_07940 [compost metagenome]
MVGAYVTQALGEVAEQAAVRAHNAVPRANQEQHRDHGADRRRGHQESSWRARCGDEKPRDRGGNDAAAAESHGDQRHRRPQQRARQQTREKRRARGFVDGARQSPKKCAEREVPQLRHAEHRSHANHDHRECGVGLRGADQLARIDPIGQHASQQRQGELGHEAA